MTTMSLLCPPTVPPPTPLPLTGTHNCDLPPIPFDFQLSTVNFLAVFCTRAKPIPFLFNLLRTLHKNTRVSPQIAVQFFARHSFTLSLEGSLVTRHFLSPLSATLTKNTGEGACYPPPN